MGFAILFVALHSIPAAIRDRRWFWLLEIVVLPLAIAVAATATIGFFDLAEPNVWYTRTQEVRGVIQALILAYLGNRALTLFVWQGVLKRYADALPGIVRNLIGFFVYLIAVYTILANVFNQPVTGLLVSSGIALGVLGLAFQSTLTDIITGVALAIERPFSVGDWVELESGRTGKVESIDWRATSLRTISGTTHVIPNNQIANTSIHNLSRPGPTYCLKVYISVSAEIAPDEARRLLLEAAIAAPDILDRPAPIVRIFDAERRPIKYLAMIHCADYGVHPVARESFLLHAWRLLHKAGAEIASETRQFEFKQPREISFHDTTEAELISGVELFYPLGHDERQRLLAASTTHDLNPGSQIVKSGDEGQSFFLLLSGMVRIFLPPGDGRSDDLELALLDAGSYFGEMSLLTGESRSASISAHTRVRILEIPKAPMAKILEKRPELAAKLAQLMAERKLKNEGTVQNSDGQSFTDRLSQTARELLGKIQAYF